MPTTARLASDEECSMSREAVADLLDRYINDPLFRARLRADPRRALDESGLDLTPEERKSLETVDWTLPDTQLQERITK
jgi:hypothetical protein